MIRHLESGVEGVPLFFQTSFQALHTSIQSGHFGVFFFGFSCFFLMQEPDRRDRTASGPRLCHRYIFFSSAAFWLEAFFHVKLIGAVLKRWNAAKPAHGLFPLARERSRWMKKLQRWLLVGASWIGWKEKKRVMSLWAAWLACSMYGFFVEGEADGTDRPSKQIGRAGRCVTWLCDNQSPVYYCCL